MHTVLESACTGCELCLPPCPVDCIELLAKPFAAATHPANRRRWPDEPDMACIRCGDCQDVCPVDLRPQEMLWFGSGPDSRNDLTDPELARCIECGLCNQVCPSNIDLVGQFERGRQQLAERATAEREAAVAGDRFANHQARLAARSTARSERRKDRIAARAQRNW